MRKIYSFCENLHNCPKRGGGEGPSPPPLCTPMPMMLRKGYIVLAMRCHATAGVTGPNEDMSEDSIMIRGKRGEVLPHL